MTAAVCERCNVAVPGKHCPKCGRFTTPRGPERSRGLVFMASGLAVLAAVAAFVLLRPGAQPGAQHPGHLDDLEGVELTTRTAEPRVPKPEPTPARDSSAILREDDAKRAAQAGDEALAEATELGTVGLLNDPRDAQASPPSEPRAPSNLPNPPPGIRIRMAAPQVTGQLPAEDVRRVVRQRFVALRLCYERGLQKDPQLSGKVTLRFVIEPTGSVAKGASATSEFADSSVATCIVQLLQELRFPPPAKGTVAVEFPIALTLNPAKPVSAHAD